MAKGELTAKQRRFVEEYLVENNATQSAIIAGYSEKTAYSAGQRLLKHVEVAAAIAEAQQKVSERIQYTIDDHMRELEEVRAKAMETEPIFDSDGNHVGDQWRTASAAIRAIELKGKVIGAYVERREVAVSEHRTIQIVRIPDNNRRRLPESVEDAEHRTNH